ncbi:leishmanolysin-like peptidase 2 [Sphaeramia orbicularis]|uniref:leishmanolysin-like peptidase 2 n=1 Tax=Sphaeramia orbicularis TaxID=375764 RepID=UPI00118063AA|nr:leishmanolysin-like peptidase 2 [Sphaeramia orbicularis]
MALAPSHRLWVGMLAVVVLLLVEFPRSLPKCIFDEVQAQVRPVRAAPIHQDRPPTQNTIRDPTGDPGPRASRSTKLRKQRDPPTTTQPQPIRIKTWTPRESSSLSDAERGRLEEAVEEAVRMVSSLLSVNRVSGPLLLRRDINKYCKFLWRNSSSANYNRCGRANNNYRTETCLDVTIPEDHLGGCDVYPDPDSPRRTVLRPEGAGVADTDFLLYLHVLDTDKCRAEPGVLAYAVHCQMDTTGRPVAGVVVICRDRLTGATYDHLTTVQTVIHELFHALGFSKDLFHSWRDCSSSSPGCSPWGKVVHPDASGQMRIYTRSVVSALQKHLKSTDPDTGGALENLDVLPGRVSSHWESRVLQGSIMAAVLGGSTTVRIDRVTLAAFQDTGWYTVNLSRAQSLIWGEAEGASFGSLSTCKDNSSKFFCTGSDFGCHYLHLHKGKCLTDPYLEGCRIYKPLKNGSECWKTENSWQSVEDEVFGFESRCFFSSLTRQNPSLLLNSSMEGRCYRHRCVGFNKYQIQVSGSEWVDCPSGDTVQINGYQGYVLCPDKRLCLFHDAVPPSRVVSPSPASITSAPSETSAQNRTWSPHRPAEEVTVLTALCIVAAVSLTAAVRVSYKKYRSCRIRIHTS